MSNRVTFAAVTVAATVAGIGFAEAADLPIEQEFIIEEPVVEYHPPAYYARADCAYAFMMEPDMKVGATRSHYVQKNGGYIKIEDGWACGLGLGMEITHHVRLDLTLEHRGKFDVQGVRDPSVAGSTDQDTGVSSWVGMVNAYYDFGNYYGFTPYVGAGIGFAHNSLEDSVTQAGFITNGDDNTDLAWALMAGMSYDLDRDLKLDFGYRYIQFGGVTSSNVCSGNFCAVGATTPVEVDGLEAHEIRVGLRYEFW